MATNTAKPAAKATNRGARLASLYDKLSTQDMAPYWAVENSREDHDEDDQILKAQKARPFIWKYSEIEPLL